MRRGNIIKLVALVLLVAAAVAISIKPLVDPVKGILLGLDLRGGVHLVLQAEQDKNGVPITKVISTKQKQSSQTGSMILESRNPSFKQTMIRSVLLSI